MSSPRRSKSALTEQRLMLLSFDADAAAGGIGNDQLSRAAAEAIERAI